MLINPQGITFGPQASLLLPGAFMASTAESVLFDGGVSFSAVTPQASPLLSVSTPIGLQMGARSGAIALQGDGHSLIGGSRFPSIIDAPTGLQLSSGDILGLVGKEITLTGSTLQNLAGDVVLNSIESGLLSLERVDESWSFDTSTVDRFGDITLSDSSLINTSSPTPGNIYLAGNDIELSDGSVIIIQASGFQPSGDILLEATGQVALSGAVRNAPDQPTPFGNVRGAVASKLVSETLGPGDVGEIVVSAKDLRLSDGGVIISRVLGDSFERTFEGQHLIDIETEDSVRIERSSSLDPLLGSGIVTLNQSNRSVPDIEVDTKNISISEAGVLASYTFGTGSASDITLRATEDISLSGYSLDFAGPATIGSAAFSSGNSGRVKAFGRNRSVLDGAAFGTATLAGGNAGSLEITVSDDVLVSGSVPSLLLSSRIGSDAPVFDATLQQLFEVPSQPSGNSGDLVLKTSQLTVTDGGTVSVRNEGLGDSGSLQINANQVRLDTAATLTGFSTSSWTVRSFS